MVRIWYTDDTLPFDFFSVTYVLPSENGRMFFAEISLNLFKLVRYYVMFIECVNI